MAGDGRRREVVALDLAHQVLVHVRLPRHLGSPGPLISRALVGRALKDGEGGRLAGGLSIVLLLPTVCEVTDEELLLLAACTGPVAK